MQRDLVIKGRSLGGSFDLTLLAPIKPGFTESLDSVTHKTRIKRVLETLHSARTATHEHATARLLSDSVERVGAIHSVRVAVLEPEDKVLLAVTFDGSWESYIRVLWDKVGSLLDLIFLGTEGYVTASGHPFEEWQAWARVVQVESGFFFGPAESSARDTLYHRRVERMCQRGEGAEAQRLRAVLPSAEGAVERLVDPPNPTDDDDSAIGYVGAPRMVRERVRSGLQGLTLLYRLTDLHRPGTPDGDVLRRAAIDLLLEFVRMRDFGLIRQELLDARQRFERQLDWLFPIAGQPVLARRTVPPLLDNPMTPAIDADVQGGILKTYENVTHGGVLLMAFDHPAAAAGLLGWLLRPQSAITAHGDPHNGAMPGEGGAKRIFRNLAFTAAGLRAAGVDDNTLELFPEEFNQGMAARAGLLGDVRNNHPRRWRLPQRFVHLDQDPGAETIGLDAVHAVLHFRCLASGSEEEAAVELKDKAHPLRIEVKALLDAAIPGLRLLAVQTMRRRYATVHRGDPKSGDEKKVIVEHFGYADGDGQPEISRRPSGPQFVGNRVRLGEIVLGHDNAVDFAIDPRDPSVPAAARERMRWLGNGSFLVLRKYRQFAARLAAAVGVTAKVVAEKLGISEAVAIEKVYAQLMGRDRAGQPLIAAHPHRPNDFTYDLDPQGRVCPLHSHIRRVHPRQSPDEVARVPRLMRRSMAYGPATDPKNPIDDADRGLVFMAYNASLGEQFEVVQRWLVGGNSTGSSSGQSCPIVGVPDNGVSRHFAFVLTNAQGAEQVFRVELEASLSLFDAPPVAAQLEWGLYLFAPAIGVLKRLRGVAAAAAAHAPAAEASWTLDAGRRLLAQLQGVHAEQGDAAVKAWKAAIEDPEAIDRQHTAALFEAIRTDHGGVLDTPYGVIVASRELLHEVLLDSQRRYSVCGQLDRMRSSFGEIALGLDEGAEYRRLADPVNAELGRLPVSGTFELARNAATTKIDLIVEEAEQQSSKVGELRFEVGFDAREVVDEVLAELTEAWFGLTGPELRRGGSDWSWQHGQPPLYPGHFTALSRYLFQPHPGAVPQELGRDYGRALRCAMFDFVSRHRDAGTLPQYGGSAANVTASIFNSFPARSDDDFVARTIVGVIMGFTPTLIGAVLNVLREWHREGRIGDLRAQLAGATDHATASDVLAAPMRAAAQMRPMPPLAWRTALSAHRLAARGHAGVEVTGGRKVVLALASGTQQSLADGVDDGRLMFGGVRKSAGDSPTHACPGYTAGIAAMLGTLAAIVGYRRALRPGPTALSFVVEAEVEVKAEAGVASRAPVAPATDRESLKALVQQETAAAMALPGPKPGSRKGVVLAWGDSWLDHSALGFDVGTDLRDWLQDFGYTAPEKFCKYTRWPRAETLAADVAPFCAYLQSQLLAPVAPVAILLSAGGNDSTEGTLRELINDKAAGVPVIDTTRLENHIKRLHRYCVTLLKAIGRVLDDHEVQTTLPVLMHGYDHPIPKGESRFGGTYAQKWMYTPFAEKGYPWATDRAATTAAMAQLIDALNAMLAGLETEFPFVRYVDLRGTIAGQWPHPKTSDGWSDDLHPTVSAFRLLAARVDEVIVANAPQAVIGTQATIETAA